MSSIDVMSDSTGRIIAEKMDTQNRFLAAIAEGSGSLKPASWSNTQTLVRANLIDKIVGIADRFTAQKSGSNLVWDVIGINHDAPSDAQYDKSLTLQLHDCLPAGMLFDAPEAFYYCETELAAGTYHFLIDSTYDTAYNTYGSTGYQFTLTQAVPAGGQLTFNWGYQTQASEAMVSSFESASAAAATEQVAVSSGTDGQELGTLTPAGDFDNNLNSVYRVRYGSNNYKESAIRQWLNSDAEAGSVWTPQTKFDRPPSWAASTAGFMNGMDADFLAAIGKTHIVAARNTVCDGGGYDEMDDYFFLLSGREVYAEDEASGVSDGEPYPYYADYSDLASAGNGADGNRIKYRSGSTLHWWNRTPYLYNSSAVSYITVNGDSSVHHAYDSGGVVPACNII